MVSVTCFFSSRVSPVSVIRSLRDLKALCGDSLVRLASPNLSPPPAISVQFAKSNPVTSHFTTHRLLRHRPGLVAVQVGGYYVT
eukprot:3103815-Rhodomonas_salina.1